MRPISYLVITVLFLCSIQKVEAQKTGKSYKLLAQSYLQKENTDTAAIYFDSAFHKYVEQNHYASATVAYFPLAELLQAKGLTDSLHYYMRTVYDSAGNARRYRNSNSILDLKKELTQYYYNNYLLDSARAIIENTLPSMIRMYGRRSANNSELYYIKSLLEFYEGDLKLSTGSMKSAISTNRDQLLNSKVWIDYIEISLIMENSSVLNELKAYSREFSERATIEKIYEILSIYKSGNIDRSVLKFTEVEFEQDSTTSTALILKYNYLWSLLLLEKGEYDESLRVALEYLPLVKQNYPLVHPISADYFEQICRIYYEKSDFGAARDFIENLIQDMEQELDPGHPLKAESYYEYSKVLMALERFSESSPQIDSAITITKHNFQKELIFLGRCFNQRGILDYYQNSLDSSEFYLKQSLKILDSNLQNKQHVYLAKVFNDLGRLYQVKAFDENSIRDYLKSLKIYGIILGKVHPNLGMGYYNVGTLYARNKNYKEALKYYQTSLISNIFDFQDSSVFSSPTLNGVLSDFILLQSLTGKVEALEAYYDEVEDDRYLYAALDSYQLITLLIDKLRTGYVSEESKQFLGEKTSYLYERAIQLSVRLSRLKNEPDFLKTAFFFSEKSRAGILLSGVKDANAKKIAGVPDSLLVIEKQLIKNIAGIELDLFDEMGKGAKARPKVVSQLQDRLFESKNTYIEFVKLLEKDYHNYYQLKYSSYTASVEEIQENILKPIGKGDKKIYTLLEYFIGKDSLYIFQIDADKYKLIVKPIDEDFEKMISGLRNSILYNFRNYFLDLSTKLYDILIPLEIPKRSHLIIVPDGKLSYLPFESLVKERSKKPLNKQNYLIVNSSISYSYSATLSVEMSKVPYDYENEQQGFTGFAPVFDNKPQYKVMSTNSDLSRELTIGDTNGYPYHRYKKLPGSELELETIFKKVNGKKFDTRAYFYNSASKSTLLESNSLDSRFLHFATHGILDEKNPDFSGIVLSDSSGTEMFTLGEIYGISTNTEVVVLSACETGLGKVLQGEGLVSFSRGFFFAGSKFIIVSLWEVSDESTTEVMVQFYSKYANMKRKDIYRSFQKARVKVLKNKKYDNLTDWFPFVLIGTH